MKTHKAIAKLVITPRSREPISKDEDKNVAGLYKVMLIGVGLFTKLPFDNSEKIHLEKETCEQELWECEIKITPIKKYKDKGIFRGYRADQVLTGHYEKPEMWGEVYYEKKDYVFNPLEIGDYFG